MLRHFQTLDRILRGELTRPSALMRGEISIPVGGITLVIFLLSGIYGACMGWFAIFNWRGGGYQQMIASSGKMPLLFLLTLIVTFPSLYVFNALVGSRLTMVSVMKLLIAALSVMVAVQASFGPIVAFFSVSTSTYAFMVLLNVIFCFVAGSLGLFFLLQTLHRLTVAKPPEASASQTPIAVSNGPVGNPPEKSNEPEGALDQMEGFVLGQNVRAVFYCWIFLFGLVGAQMSWVLRPFIGNPNEPFAFLRRRESNFFEAVFEVLRNLLT